MLEQRTDFVYDLHGESLGLCNTTGTSSLKFWMGYCVVTRQRGESITKAIVRFVANRDSTAGIATYLADAPNVSEAFGLTELV